MRAALLRFGGWKADGEMPSNGGAGEEPFYVTIPVGLSMCLKSLLEAKDSDAALHGLDKILLKASESAGADLPLVRRAAIESNAGALLVKLGKKVLDSAKAALALHSLVRLLVRPPTKGVTDVADPLRRSLIESAFGPHCVETLSKYADQGAIAEVAALNVQYVFNAPASWDALQPTVAAGAVTSLAAVLLKSSAHEGAVAASLETLAFIAHVDATKRKGEWGVVARLADAEAWNTISVQSLGKHGASGRVAAAAMLLLGKCASSPKSANFLRGMSAAGLFATALRFARRSVQAADGGAPRGRSATRGAAGARGGSASPGRSSSPGSARGGGGDLDPSMSATLGATAAPKQGLMGPVQAVAVGPPVMRSYTQHAWALVAEVAAKAPESLVGGEPEHMVRLLLAPMLNPLPNQLPQARLALGVLASLVRNSPDFLVTFVSAGGCAALARLVDVLRVPDAAASQQGADVLLTLADMPAVLPAVVGAGGFDVLVNAYFRAWEVAPRDMANFAPRGTPAGTQKGNSSAANRLAVLRTMADGIVRISRADDSRREMLATVVANALANSRGDVGPRHVRAAACLVAWTVGGNGAHAPDELDGEPLEDAKAYVAAGATSGAFSAMRAFALQDPVLGALLGALRVLLLVPPLPEEEKRASVAPRPGDSPPPPPEAPGHQTIAAVLDVLKTSLKRTSEPDMAVWTPLFVLLESTLGANPANVVDFLRWPGLLGLLSRFLEWALRVCDAEEYRQWRIDTRPPAKDEEAAKKLGEEAKAAALAEGADPQAAAALMQEVIDVAMTPTETAEETSQWVLGRIVRLFNIACGENGANSGTVAQIRAAGLHRKVADFVLPWVHSLSGDGLEEPEIDNGALAAFLGATWRVMKDGAYSEWEKDASRDDILLVKRKFPAWRCDESLLTEAGNGWRYEANLARK